jgi:TM2 domain-containing membrane protein YozV
MQGSGFGRKGIGAGGPAGPQPTPARRIEVTRNPPQPSPAPRREYDVSSAFGPAKTDKSMLTAYLLWFFLGQLGAHRFYLGATMSAIAQLGFFFFAIAFLAMGMPWAGLGIFLMLIWLTWILIDLFLIPGIHRQFCRSGPAYDLDSVYS